MSASGKNRVRQKSDNRVGFIPANEFDPNLYEKL